MDSNPGTQPPEILTTQFNWFIDRNECLRKLNKGKPGVYIKSQTFFDDKYWDVKWHLLLYPNGLNKNVKGSVSLYAICESASAYNSFALVPPKIECLIESASGGENIGCLKLCVSHDTRANCWGFPKFMTSSQLFFLAKKNSCNSTVLSSGTGALIGRSLRMECKISQVLNLVSTDHKCPLHCDIGQLLKTQKFSDVRLKVNEEIFHAHKLILATRSPVFAAMFEHKMSENADSFVDIVDTDNEVFKEMLTYIYTEQAPNLKDTAFGLLAVADKYQLDKLKDMCSIYLGDNLTTENDSDVLILADLHQCTKLKAKAIAFTSKRRRRV